ncbi:MAG: MBOAT family protein, partial [Clostridia bacterium]|nr:MBOAT family protein [Clostridia bacterium]
NLAAVWLLTGFWHGASWNYVLWGVYYLIILVIEKNFLLKWLEKMPAVVTHLYSLFLISTGFVIFQAKELASGFAVIGALFGIGADSLYVPAGVYEFVHVLPLLLVCFIGATPIPALLWKKLREKWSGANWLIPVYTAAVLLLCTAYLVDSTFSPFLYFEF